MKNVFATAPGVIWVAVIIGLAAAAEWLSQFYGGLEWVPPLVGFLTIVAIPLLKVFATNETPATRGELAVTPARTKFSRWLW